mmetsp:Transcript_33233/g.82757  ORF Transcript_33233/g.82757 Transcript_33233/m.82757 type:complete len:217 (-) Transcript_33233:828-1478(-)
MRSDELAGVAIAWKTEVSASSKSLVPICATAPTGCAAKPSERPSYIPTWMRSTAGLSTIGCTVKLSSVKASESAAQSIATCTPSSTAACSPSSSKCVSTELSGPASPGESKIAGEAAPTSRSKKTSAKPGGHSLPLPPPSPARLPPAPASSHPRCARTGRLLAAANALLSCWLLSFGLLSSWLLSFGVSAVFALDLMIARFGTGCPVSVVVWGRAL